VASLRRSALALGVAWPVDQSYGDVVSGLDAAVPAHAALLVLATRLLRGAGYTAFDGAPPEQPLHSGVALPYAHVTAPLRRLADRYATEACLALHEGRDVPEWAREALAKLPKVMSDTDRTASAADRGAVSLTEAVLLADRVGEVFDAAVLDVDDPPVAAPPSKAGGRRTRRPGGTVALDDPPVVARCDGELPLGERVSVRLTVADPGTRTVLFETT
jgi:exoribonuclease R